MGAGFRKQVDLKSWRKIAVHTWHDVGDPSVYGILEVDVSKTLPWIDKQREQTGLKVTITHLVGRAMALAIAERPEVNAIIRRGRHIYLRDTIDIFFQVAFEGGENLSGAKISEVDKKSVVDIARELADRAERIRKKTDIVLQQTHGMMDKIPGMLRGPMLRTASYLTYDLGLDLRSLGLPYDQFGSAMITNVGAFGLQQGFAPLVPFARTPILATIGAVYDKPVAIGGKVEIRPMLPIGGTFDHRLLDGYQAGRITQRFREVIEDPERFA